MIRDVTIFRSRMTSLCIIDTDIDNAGKESKELKDMNIADEEEGDVEEKIKSNPIEFFRAKNNGYSFLRDGKIATRVCVIKFCV